MQQERQQEAPVLAAAPQVESKTLADLVVWAEREADYLNVMWRASRRRTDPGWRFWDRTIEWRREQHHDMCFLLSALGYRHLGWEPPETQEAIPKTARR
jgi:hypothetical protein